MFDVRTKKNRNNLFVSMVIHFKIYLDYLKFLQCGQHVQTALLL
jgi:hypothetical protein